ncbi:hypothetical protein LQ567_20100 [Niabella pedocola]|uniref:Uncharacterized protein n=1 Tax=Niabella pedocola TaxID=1752077 RepID=A0ABS8PVK2_9BACT|nr:hypothetical protein [Niabella pedocola]MCD2425099.1 hypothetical protein [Niabella pedocola]
MVTAVMDKINNLPNCGFNTSKVSSRKLGTKVEKTFVEAVTGGGKRQSKAEHKYLN